MRSIAFSLDGKSGANPPSSPTAVEIPSSSSCFFSVWKTSTARRSPSENVSAPPGTIMNSWRSSELSACAPPLTTFSIGTGSTCASVAADPAVERQTRLRGGRLRRRKRGAEDRVRAETSLVRRPVELDQRGVDRSLLRGVEPDQRLRDLGAHVLDRLADALARATRSDRRRGARPPRTARSRRPTARPPAPPRRSRPRLRPRPSGCRASRGSGAHARLRSGSSSEHLLRGVEVPVLLVERELGEDAPVVVRQHLGALDPVGEAPRRRSQRELGVDVQPPRDVDRREQDVADLLEDVRVRLGLGIRLACVRERRLQLAKLVVEIGERPVRVRVLEVDRRRAALELARVEQRGQRLGDVVEDPFAALVVPLDLAPSSRARGRPCAPRRRRTRAGAGARASRGRARAACSRSPCPCSSSSSARK